MTCSALSDRVRLDFLSRISWIASTGKCTLSPSPSATVAAGLCSLALLPAAPVVAQLPRDVQRVETCEVPADPEPLARRFAPTLIFGPQESDFPTIPFFTAFDGKPNFESDSSSGSGIDFDNPDELVPGQTSAPVNGQVSWDRLHAEAHRRDDDGRLGDGVPPAVFYRMRTLEDKERQALWRFLRKDTQAWRRFEMDAVLDQDLEYACFLSLEYYYYYLNDRGLVGHKQDIEFSFLFLPRDPELASRFRVLVAAAHGSRTPNNVLVLFETEDPDEPRHITVELGGHASAPSRDRADGFRIGRDVNWHAAQAWGTRDVLATTGTAFMGPYRTGMTYPRDIELAMKLFGRRNVHASPLDSIAFSTGRWTFARLYDSSMAPNTDCFTMCRTPTAFAASAAFSSSCVWFSAFGPRRNSLSHPLNASRSISGRS